MFRGIVPLKFQVFGLNAQAGYQLFSYMYLHVTMVTEFGRKVKIFTNLLIADAPLIDFVDGHMRL